MPQDPRVNLANGKFKERTETNEKTKSKKTTDI